MMLHPLQLNLRATSNRPGLLVSVRDSVEAFAALDGGADVIDVKEPNRGPLGRADWATIDEIVKAVAGRAPVSAALGELIDFDDAETIPARELAFFKFGLAGCRLLGNWQKRWQETVARIRQRDAQVAQPVAVVYADWISAAAPEPGDVLSATIEIGCPILLIDTWNKAGGALFEHWPAAQVQAFVAKVRATSRAVALAGSLDGEQLVTAGQLRPNLLAVRGAACEGGRAGRVTTARVRNLKNTISELALPIASITSTSVEFS